MIFQPVIENKDLSVHANPDFPWLAVICRWKDAHTFRRKHPSASVVGPLRTLRGIDLLFRSLLANPQIRVVMVDGVDLTPNDQTTAALYETWAGSNAYLGEDVQEHADLIRFSSTGVSLKVYEKGLVERLLLDLDSLGSRGGGSIVLSPPSPTSFSVAPHGDPGERVAGNTLKDVWPSVLQQAMSFGRVVPTQYGDTRELINLVSVIRKPEKAMRLPDWILGHDQVAEYSERLFNGVVPDGALYSYGSRLMGGIVEGDHVQGFCWRVGGQVALEEGVCPECGWSLAAYRKMKQERGTPDQIHNLKSLLSKSKDTRAAFVTPWNPAEDSGLESGRPCLVGAWFRAVDGALHATVMFRSHDLYAAYPLNLAASCAWLVSLCEEQELKPGTLTCISCSAHVYDRDWKDALDVVSNHFPKENKWDQRTTWTVDRSAPGILRAMALTPDGNSIVRTFEGSSVVYLRTQIEQSGLIQSVGSALWLGAELERVMNAD